MAGFSLDTEACPDVYRGLARLLRPSPTPWKVVVVCLDGMGACEMEFFSIASRLRRDVKIFVYAAKRADLRMARAIELGAVGLTRDALAELMSSAPSSTSAEPAVGKPEGVRDPLPSSAVPVPAPITVPDPPRADGEDPKKPARVPWLRYGDRPTRVAPTTRAPAADAPPQVDRPAPRTVSFEPLLTEEELRALMSDDITALPGERMPRPPDDQGLTRGMP